MCNGDARANVDLDETYSSFGYNAFCIQMGLYFGGHDYDTEMEWDGINRFGWQYHGDGYHNTTRYGEELNDDDPRKGSLSTVYRTRHPGPLGFQTAADAFAYVYVTGLMKELDIIEGDMMAGAKNSTTRQRIGNVRRHHRVVVISCNCHGRPCQNLSSVIRYTAPCHIRLCV